MNEIDKAIIKTKILANAMITLNKVKLEFLKIKPFILIEVYKNRLQIEHNRLLEHSLKICDIATYQIQIIDAKDKLGMPDFELPEKIDFPDPPEMPNLPEIPDIPEIDWSNLRMPK